jgi:3-hydroxyisobutyrate dehydrogenase-like beta-hydroxyacid dehydrogenase
MESGTLTLLCGGEESDLENLKPTLSAIAAKILYFGPAGQGMRYKLILNFLQAVHIIGFGQAMKIAKNNGMDLKKVGDALSERPGGVITSLAWRDYQKEPDPINFSVEWITKDLTYAKKLAGHLDLSFLEDSLALYKQAAEKGFSKKDWASINTVDIKEK